MTNLLVWSHNETVKSWRHHREKILATSEGNPPWPQMIICSLATGAPLILGLWQGNIGFAIYASLLGYLVSLNDHLGGLGHRLWVGTLSFIGLFAAFSLGIALHENLLLYQLVFLTLTYWLGLMGGRGAEVERLILFSLAELLLGYYGRRLSLQGIGPLAIYGFLAYAVIIAGMFISHQFSYEKNLQHARLRQSLQISWTFSRSRHLYALSFMLTVGSAIFYVQYFELDRGYWLIMTILLILRPDRQETVYRSLQRFLGTVAGIVVGEGIIALVYSDVILLAGVMIAAFFIPLAAKRNYWILTFFISIVVIFLMSFPELGQLDLHLPWLRIQATFLGCLFCVFGALLFKGLERIFAAHQKI